MLNKLFKRKTYKTLNTVRVHASALRHNLELYRKNCTGRAIAPVLKSNAYGHGLVNVAQVLDPTDCPFLVVDSLYEAYELQKNKIKTPVLILGYTHTENLMGRKLPFHFTAFDLKSAKQLAQMKVPVHLEVDTGMNRMGFSIEQLKAALPELKALQLNVVGLFTHFADADNPEDNSYTQKQTQLFQKAIQLVKEAGFTPKWIHTGGSGSNLKVNIPEVNMLRIGIELYGASPYHPKDSTAPQLATQQVMEFSATIIAKRHLKKGDKVSYGCTFEAPRDMTIGVLSAGYYEGIPRTLSNESPFVGRICMNHSIVELESTGTARKELNSKVGSEHIIYSKDRKSPLCLNQMALKAGTIPYELMVRIAESVRRETID